jgi:hypothetical protein
MLDYIYSILLQYVTLHNIVLVICIGTPILVGWSFWGKHDAINNYIQLFRKGKDV